MMPWISSNDGETYNGCHYWSNFEIARVDFWRSEAYRAYFKHLDRAGGFFYERWGDGASAGVIVFRCSAFRAPFHLAAASLMGERDPLFSTHSSSPLARRLVVPATGPGPLLQHDRVPARAVPDVPDAERRDPLCVFDESGRSA